MSLTAASISTYIADKIFTQFLKEEGYGRLKLFFSPKKKYKHRLEEIIFETIKEYSKTYPLKDTLTQFPFYKSQILFDLLNQHILFSKNNSDLLIDEFKKNENILVPEKDQLITFYSFFIEKVNNDKVLTELFFDEGYKEEIFKVSNSLDELLTVSKKILDKVNTIEKKLDSSALQIQSLRNRFQDPVTFHNLYQSRGLDIYTKSEKSSSRTKVVEQFRLYFTEKTHIHIYGNISTGKTQLAVLLCETFQDKYWIDLKDIDSKVVIQIILTELSNYFEHTIKTQNDLEFLINKLPKHSVVVLDDLPKLELVQKDLELFKLLLDLLHRSGIKVISTSNYKLTSKVVEHLNDSFFVEKPIPLLSEEEIQDILILYEASPETAKLLKQIVLTTSLGHPVIVNAICRYLHNEKWTLDALTLKNIFSGTFSETLDEETFERIIKTISDDQAKDLLYRTKLVIGYISNKEIEVISAVSPSISYPFEKVTILSGLWLQNIKPNFYEISPLIKRLKTYNLSPSLYKAINTSLGEHIISLKRINQVMAKKAIIYFINAGNYNRAGFILSLVLEESLSQPDLFFDWGFNIFWSFEPLPEDMDIYLQSIIRYFQINLFLNIKTNTDYLVSDLEIIIEKASKKNINLTHVAFLLSILFSETDPKKSSTYLILGLKHYDELKTDRNKNALSEYPILIESLVWNNLLNVKSIQDFNFWLERFSNLETTQKQNPLEAEISQISSMLFCSKAYDETSISTEPNWESLLIFYKTIAQKSELLKINILLACSLKFQIRCLCNKLADYRSAINLYEENISKFENDKVAEFLVMDELGRQLYYLDKKEDSLNYLIDASHIEVPKIFTEKIDTYLALNTILGQKDIQVAHQFALKAFNLQNENEFVDEVFSAKVIGELAISTWELSKSKEVFYILEKGLYKLIFSYKPLKEYQGTIIRYGHILNYYFHQIANLVLKDIDGSPYAIPFRSSFLKNNDILLEGGYYFEQRKFMSAYLMATSFEEINDKNLASKWAYICFKLKDEDILNPFVTLLTGLNSYLILDGKFEDAVILEIYILKTLNDLNSEDNIESKLNNDRLSEIIKDRPRTIFDSFDDLLFEHVINFIIVKSLWDYVLNENSSPINELQNTLKSINDYFIDKEPLSILIQACILFSANEQNDEAILNLATTNNRLNTQITLLLYLFASFKAGPKKALELHLALIQRLEMVSTSISKASYKFLVVPFFVDFWEHKAFKNKSSFFQYNLLVSKGLISVDNTVLSVKLKVLFNVLCYHLEMEPRENEATWLANR